MAEYEEANHEIGLLEGARGAPSKRDRKHGSTLLPREGGPAFMARIDDLVRRFFRLADYQASEWPRHALGTEPPEYRWPEGSLLASVLFTPDWGRLERSADLRDGEVSDSIEVYRIEELRSRLDPIIEFAADGRARIATYDSRLQRIFESERIRRRQELLRVRDWNEDEILGALRANAFIAQHALRELRILGEG